MAGADWSNEGKGGNENTDTRTVCSDLGPFVEGLSRRCAELLQMCERFTQTSRIPARDRSLVQELWLHQGGEALENRRRKEEQNTAVEIDHVAAELRAYYERCRHLVTKDFVDQIVQLNARSLKPPIKIAGQYFVTALQAIFHLSEQILSIMPSWDLDTTMPGDQNPANLAYRCISLLQQTKNELDADVDSCQRLGANVLLELTMVTSAPSITRPTGGSDENIRHDAGRSWATRKPSVELFGVDENPRVFGQKVDRLTPRQYAIIELLLRKTSEGASLKDLGGTTKVLDRIRTSNQLWAKAIRMPGTGRGGGYKIRPMDDQDSK
jgi:hypothetical protein